MYVDILGPVIMEDDYKLRCNQFKSEEMGSVGLNFYVETTRTEADDVSQLKIDVEGDFKFIETCKIFEMGI